MLAVGIGGGVGAILRYAVTGVAQGLTERFAWSLPVGTLTVNVIGSLVLGALAATVPLGGLPPVWRLALGIGVLGGFTTFSTFAYETFELLRDGQFAAATLNILLNNALAIVAALLGFRLVQRLYGG